MKIVESIGNVKTTCRNPKCLGIINIGETRLVETCHNVHYGGILNKYYHLECYSGYSGKM